MPLNQPPRKGRLLSPPIHVIIAAALASERLTRKVQGRRFCKAGAHPVGVFYMTDEKGSDEKVICTSVRDPAWLHVRDIDDLQPEYRDEIEHFFQLYKDLEKKKTATEASATAQWRSG
jgi:Inorganic pyrophosphatase